MMKSKVPGSVRFVLIALAAVCGAIVGQANTVVGQSGAGVMFTGGVGDSKLVMEITRDGGDISGSYYYLKSGSSKKLMLKGNIAADGTFTMQESDAAGKQTGEFRGKWKDAETNENGASLEGEWLKPGQTENGAYFYGFEQMIYFAKTQITTREFNESVKAKKATLSAEYPELAGNANAAGFNRIAKAKVMRSIARFREELAGMTAADLKLMGKANSYINVAYGVEFADDDLISVNFFESTFSGGAHPNQNAFTLTYDLKAGRELKLADLFKPRTKFLSTIADYCMHDLKARKDPDSGENMGFAQDIFEDGAKPTAENYANWNITKKGLLITFPPYQVAAYVYGQQSVIIPWLQLKEIAQPEGGWRMGGSEKGKR